MTKEAAFGAELQMEDTPGGGMFTAIAHVQDITGPSLSQDTADVTAHDSPGRWEEHVGTILRSGEVTFDIVYDPADGTHDASTGLLDALESDTAGGRDYKLIFSDTANTTWTFPALVTGFEPGNPVADGRSASVSLKITGAPTLV